jgi:hypothetical protein
MKREVLFKAWRHLSTFRSEFRARVLLSAAVRRSKARALAA